jgi:hypothetical protein
LWSGAGLVVRGFGPSAAIPIYSGCRPGRFTSSAAPVLFVKKVNGLDRLKLALFESTA